jgi:hypothetical protein
MSSKKFKVLIFLISSLLVSFVAVSCASASLLAPKITFNAPPGNIYSIGDVTVSVSISNSNIIYKPGEPPLIGEGTLVYFLDTEAPVVQGVTATTAQGTWATTDSTTYVWHNVGSGSHSISVELVNNDLTPLSPAVVSTMQIEVVPEPGAPKAVILSPRENVILAPGTIPISVEVNNFVRVENTGQNPAAGEGHILYFLDVEAPTNPGDPATTVTGTYIASAATSYTWTDVPEGTHTFTIELVNDDDTPLSPAVIATVTITVTK